MFEHHEKPRVIRIGTVEMILGLVALALAMNGAVLLVTDVIFDAGIVAATVAVLFTLYITLWFGLGVARRVRSPR
jgi:VIT1/CCC1 family predicted Fe2+/Mn2+ transporter